MEDFKYIFVPFVTLIIAQIIKFTIESIEAKRLKWGRLFNGSGGMPSAHSSFSFSVTMMIGLNQGFETPLFAVSLIFALIVAYDAMGLRMESGKHAETINQIAEEILSVNYQTGIKHLKEELGHNPAEVLMGMVLGIVSSLIFTFLIF